MKYWKKYSKNVWKSKRGDKVYIHPHKYKAGNKYDVELKRRNRKSREMIKKGCETREEARKEAVRFMRKTLQKGTGWPASLNKLTGYDDSLGSL